ncbi:hypothetical protein D3C72_1492700 [compost metagenome]
MGDAGKVSVPVPAACAWSKAHWAMPISSASPPFGACKLPSSSGNSKVARARKARSMALFVMSKICSVCSTPDNSRENSYRARARASRCEATRAWKRRPAVRWPVIRPTASITPNVITYWKSPTANEKRGGTKMKSKLATPTRLASAAGPRPRRTATSTTVNRDSMAILARSRYGCNGTEARAVARLTPAATM